MEIRKRGRWFLDFGFAIEFSVGPIVRKAGRKPVFGDCIICAVNKEKAKIVGHKTRAERTLEVVYSLAGLKARRRITCTHGLHPESGGPVDARRGGIAGSYSGTVSAASR